MSFSEWREVKVSEIGKIVTGKTPKTAISENYGGNIPFLTPSDDMNIKKVKSTARTLSEMGLNSVKNCLLPAKSICVSCIGSDLGKVVLTSEPTVTNQQINSIVPDEKFDPDFIYYGMTILGKHLNYLSKTSTAVPIINKTTFSNFSIIVPSIEEQKAIAHILSTLDDKIEVNNQINKTLENMAQAIFKQWFVDFEFPNEDGEPYKSSGGEMVESELGMIPKGLEVGVLGDIISISSGKRPKKKSKEPYEEFVIPLIGASSTMGYVKEYNYFEPIIIIGRVGTHGVVQRFKDKVWASDNTLVIKSEYYEYVHQLLGLIDYASLNRGSTQPLITQTDIKNVRILIPYKSILNQYEELVGKLYELVNSRLDENSNLINLRDTLLPKLMSGEIRVPLKEEGEVS